MKSSSDIRDSSELVLIGKIVAAHGIKGAVRVISYAESAEIFQDGNVLWAAKSPQSADSRQKAGCRPLEISWVMPHKQGLRMAFTDIIDRNQAEAMAGTELFIEKSQLPDLEEDTYYWFDLIGMTVKNIAGELIGRIESILPTGGNDVYVVKGIDPSGEKEHLIPAVAHFIHSIDLEEKVMIVDLPEGL